MEVQEYRNQNCPATMKNDDSDFDETNPDFTYDKSEFEYRITSDLTYSENFRAKKTPMQIGKKSVSSNIPL